MKPAAIHLIAAARPNFMKVAPLYHALGRIDWAWPILVHTGQHYDTNLSENFLRDLGLPQPDFHLGVGSGSHAEQTAGVMVAYEQVCLKQRPDWVVVVGDVNSTMACAITAKKLLLPVAHLEAGLRSWDMSMPEEINRLVTDAISDLLWTPSPDADENLRREGIPAQKIMRVGNIMIDSYHMLRTKIEAEPVAEELGLVSGSYGVVTLHRPANVDNQANLTRLVSILLEIGQTLRLIFPIHPRTRKQLIAFGLWARLERATGLQVVAPMPYIRFMSLVRQAKLVITDSGGIQEETTYLNIPCLTLRKTTERPITLTQGTNCLAQPETLQAKVNEVLQGRWPQGICPELWDGHTAERVVKNLKEHVYAT